MEIDRVRLGRQDRQMRQDSKMRGLLRQSGVIFVVAAIAFAAGACSSEVRDNLSNAQLLPNMTNIAKPDWLSYSGGKEEFALRPVSSTDLVNPDGQCAIPGTAASTTSDGGGSADGAPLVAGGIALQMTE